MFLHLPGNGNSHSLGPFSSSPSTIVFDDYCSPPSPCLHLPAAWETLTHTQVLNQHFAEPHSEPRTQPEGVSLGGSQRKHEGCRRILAEWTYWNSCQRQARGGSDITWGWWDKKFSRLSRVIRYQGWGILAKLS